MGRNSQKLAEIGKSSQVEEYFASCQKHGISERNRALSLSQFLHDLGVFLHFQHDLLLKRNLVLQNDWATDGVYRILDNHQVIALQGRFTRKDAENILEEDKYAERCDELLQLMVKFELCYQVPDCQPPTFIAPQLLPVQQPNYGWDDTKNLKLHYTYDFMPKGLLSRFIVRMNRYITNSGQTWRSGVILHRQNTEAEVVGTYGKQSIRIRVKGSTPKELMTLIAEEFDTIHQSYDQLRVHKMVPCNCLLCQTLEEPNFYQYDDLQRRIEKGKATVECKNSYEDVDVKSLINTVFVAHTKVARPLKLFISYSKSDYQYLKSLKKHLEPLRRLELMISWDDNQLVPGEEWDEHIQRELESADIILLLVSTDFLATRYIQEVALATAIERHQREDAVIVPIILDSAVEVDEELQDVEIEKFVNKRRFTKK